MYSHGDKGCRLSDSASEEIGPTTLVFAKHIWLHSIITSLPIIMTTLNDYLSCHYYPISATILSLHGRIYGLPGPNPPNDKGLKCTKYRPKIVVDPKSVPHNFLWLRPCFLTIYGRPIPHLNDYPSCHIQGGSQCWSNCAGASIWFENWVCLGSWF